MGEILKTETNLPRQAGELVLSEIVETYPDLPMTRNIYQSAPPLNRPAPVLLPETGQ